MGLVVADVTAVQQAAETIAGRVAAMVRDLPDVNIPIPNSEWRVSEAAAHLAYANLGMAMMARGLAIPSRLINDCSVVRFIPSRAAAPRGPPRVQFVSRRTRRMCIRSTASRVEALSS